MINGVSKLKLALYLAAIFAAGGVSGWVVAAKTTKQKMFSPPPPGIWSSRFCERVFSNLDLSDDQKPKVREIADRYDKEMFKLQAQHGRQIGQAVSNRNAQLTLILRPEQRTKWDEMERERERQRREDFRRFSERHRSRDGDRDRRDRPPPPPRESENSTNGSSAKPPC